MHTGSSLVEDPVITTGKISVKFEFQVRILKFGGRKTLIIISGAA